jgi:hypothetical protein
VALIGDAQGLQYLEALGHFTYGAQPPVSLSSAVGGALLTTVQFDAGNPAVQIDSLYDQASLTKVLVTTTAVCACTLCGSSCTQTYLLTPASGHDILPARRA